MSVPVITPITSFNLYTRGQAFALLLAATGLPASVIAVTGTASTDLINAVAHGLPDGTRVKFTSKTGGTGLTTGTTYYVRDTLADTFKLAATAGGAAINFTTDISAAVINAAVWTCSCYDADTMAVVLADLGLTFDTATGVLRGTFTASGFYALIFTATNADGTSAALTVPIGIEDSGFAIDSASGINVDVETGEVTRTLAGAAPAAAGATTPVLFGKHASQKLVTVTFLKQGQPVSMDVTDLKLGIKQYEPEQILDVTDGTFYAIGGGFRILVDLDDADVANALGDYEADDKTLFNAIAEVRWTYYEHDTGGDAVLLISRSANFLFQLERDIIPNPA